MPGLKIVTDELFLSKFTRLNELVSAMVGKLGHDLANELEITADEVNYKYTFVLRAVDKSVLSSYTLDLPLESVVVEGRYNTDTQSIELVLKNGQTISIPIGDVINGLATTSQLNSAIASEASARNSADEQLRQSIRNEIAARQSADDDLSGRITAEAATRAAADTAALAAIQEEKEQRRDADDALADSVQRIIEEATPFFVGEDGYIYGKD